MHNIVEAPLVGAEEAFGAGEERVMVFMPANAFAALERVRDLFNVLYAGTDNFESAGRRTGLCSSARAIACSGGSVYFPVAAS